MMDKENMIVILKDAVECLNKTTGRDSNDRLQVERAKDDVATVLKSLQETFWA